MIKKILIPFILIITIILILFNSSFSNISKIKVNKKVDLELFNKYENKFLFLFFGYVGCRDICTPRLKELSLVYNHIKKDIDIDTIFINLIKLKDKELPQLFATAFNRDFDGIYLSKNRLKEITEEFKIYNAPSLISKGDWDHTAFLFLLQKESDGYYLKRIYTTIPFDKDRILNDIMELQ